jgi:hypothetical protein
MKRILFLSFVLAVVAGCAKKAEVNGNTDSPGVDSPAGTSVDATAKSGFKSGAEVSIPIDKSKVNNTWYTTNKAYIYNQNDSIYFVNLEAVGNISAIAAWLGQNDSLIKFKQLYPITISRHQITDADSAEYAAVTAVAANAYKNISYNNLRTALTNQGVNTNNQYDDLFKVNLSGAAIAISREAYQCADAIYSTPLINAIVSENNLTNPTFHFAQVSISGTTHTFMKVTEGTFVAYYDLTYRPPLN